MKSPRNKSVYYRPIKHAELEFGIESLETRRMLATIEVFAAGTTGQEAIDLEINGQRVATYSNLGAGAFNREFQSRSFSTSQPVIADDIRVRFVNDSFDSTTGSDRNVRIDAIAIDGVRFETESQEVFSTGTWLPIDGVQPGFRQSEFLHVDGYFQYSGGVGSTIQVRARGTEGGEQFRLVISGEAIGTYTTTTEFQTFSYVTQGVVSPNDIRIEYFGDFFDPSQGIDTNLVVDFVTLNGTTFQTEDPSTFSTGTWLPSDGVQPGFRQSEFLHADGYFQFAARNLGSEITIFASGDEGGERFRLVVDEIVVQTFTVGTSFESYAYTSPSVVTADQVRIEYFNDQFDPSAGIDANLNVDFITVDGSRFETDSPTTFSTGTWTAADGILPGFGRGETLNSNGYFQFLAGSVTSRFQAELASIFGPSARFGNGNANFDGGGYVEAINLPGDGVEFSVDAEIDGSFDLDIRYAAGPDGPATDRTISLFVNGNRVDTLSLSRTGDWSSWHNFVQEVQLQAGINTIRFEVLAGETGAINLDYMDVRPFAGRLGLGSTETDLLDNQTTFSSTALQVSRLATLPTNPGRGAQATRRINSIANRPDDPNAIYTASQDGRVYRVSTTGQVSLFFDVDAVIRVSRQSSFHGGLRSIAFHPDFANDAAGGFGKIYATLMADQSSPNANYIGNSQGNVDSVVAEFTFDFSSGEVVSFRELFRVRNPQFDHPIKDLSFNTAAIPGDADYGLLYIAHGDGSIFSANIGNGLVTGDALGKILRINPLASGNQPYTTPGNFFASDGDPLTLAEVFTWGHRNPHNISFGRSADGNKFLITAEIGQDSIEEINLIRIGDAGASDNGRSYGWGDRTGTFEKTGFGYRLGGGVENLRLDDGGREYVYPVIQIDHDDPFENRSIAVAGGPVINGRYFYGLFAGNSNLPGGQTYSVDVGLLLNQKTSFDAAIGESTADLTFVDDNLQHRLFFDEQTYDTFAQLLGDDIGQNTFRTDVRFGATADGRLIMTSKLNGAIYIVGNAGNLPQEFASSSRLALASESVDENLTGVQATRRRAVIRLAELSGELIINVPDRSVSTAEGSMWLGAEVRSIVIDGRGSANQVTIIGGELAGVIRESRLNLRHDSLRIRAKNLSSLQLTTMESDSKIKLAGRSRRLVAAFASMQLFELGQFRIELIGFESFLDSGIDSVS